MIVYGGTIFCYRRRSSRKGWRDMCCVDLRRGRLVSKYVSSCLLLEYWFLFDVDLFVGKVVKEGVFAFRNVVCARSGEEGRASEWRSFPGEDPGLG